MTDAEKIVHDLVESVGEEVEAGAATRTALKCIGFYRGYCLFNDGGYLFAVEDEAARRDQSREDDDIILGGDEGPASLHFIFLMIESRGRDSARPDWVRIDWR